MLKKTSPSELISRLFRESPPDAAWVFDCDGTLISGDVASHTAWGLVRSGLANREELPEYWPGLKKKPFTYHDYNELRDHIATKRGTEGIYAWEAQLQAGCPPDMIVRIAREVIGEGVGQGSLHFTDVLSEVARQRAHQAWIVSGSPQACVVAVGERLGIPAERVLATMLETVDGIFTSKILPPGVVWEKLKRLALEENGVYRPWLVAGDSIGDWAMMEAATHWRWCVVWDEHRHRGEEFRRIAETSVLQPGHVLPREPGIYVYERGDAPNWIFEVRGENQKPW
jgi:phosphoserine phosphatase